ncbi:unnamed protein product [Didymodactylos carnosus]|uniref:Endonuclease/exonuclease/phosphatase domain-containing protein n=1 Tax=Didymodactylos carnosus TaxID=1234261 RepID=A0A814YHE6_9BILA|nr:unnamed protein product [Didymodactylos carnosus]CAF1229577.1 unnamed protein product [Didymodactylos carnosus]CAF3842604.1 unnamed protein product [Didymodactylos carnosus]CAF3992286.1 unnamed protein product [Didymodactylos carnosus]
MLCRSRTEKEEQQSPQPVIAAFLSRFKLKSLLLKRKKFKQATGIPIFKDVTSTDLVFPGDFNAHCYEWCPTKASTLEGKKFYEFAKDVQLFQIVEKPTRPKSSTGLDLIFLNNLNLVEKIEILPELCCTCDHNVVKFSITIAQLPVTQYSRKIYDYRRANWDVFRDKLAELDWNELVEDGELDNRVLLVEKMILWIADFVVPYKIIVVKSNDRPWFNETLRELLKKKHELYKIDCRFKTTSSAANSRGASHDFEKACKAAQKNIIGSYQLR